VQAVLAHDLADRLGVDDHAVTIEQFGADPPPAVGAPGVDVDGVDEVGQPREAELAWRGSAAPPHEEPGGGHAQDPAAPLGREALSGQLSDDRVLGFGRTPSSNRVAACLTNASSVSNSWIRRLAAANSPRSLLEAPGRTPRSMRSWAFHRYTVASARPSSAATTRTGRPARTSSTTRRRTPDRSFVARVLLGIGTRQSHMTRSTTRDQIHWTTNRGPITELGPVVGLDDLHPERQPLQHMI
jgi:hypothetical protein